MLAGHYGYQNFYILPQKQVLFIEAHRDEKSWVYELPILSLKAPSSLNEIWRLRLEQLNDVFPLNWLLILNQMEFITGTKYGKLRCFSNW